MASHFIYGTPGFESFSNPSEAIEREKEIKGWRREKTLRLILASNPDWADLSRMGGRCVLEGYP